MTTTEQRVSHLEGAYEHLATKADLLRMENRLLEMEKGILEMENRMTREFGNIIKWVAGFQLLTIGTTLAGVAALLQFLQ